MTENTESKLPEKIMEIVDTNQNRADHHKECMIDDLKYLIEEAQHQLDILTGAERRRGNDEKPCIHSFKRIAITGSDLRERSLAWKHCLETYHATRDLYYR